MTDGESESEFAFLGRSPQRSRIDDLVPTLALLCEGNLAGDRPGLPVAMSLVGDEHHLYDTDPKFGPDSGRIERNSGGEAR